MAGKTQRYYDKNPAARRKKAEYQATFNKKPDQVKKRVALIAWNRKNKSTSTDDAYHKGGKIVGFKHQSKNRGDKDDSVGDKKSRGTRKRRSR